MKEVKSGYKRTKIGVIPIDWEVKKLGDIGDCKIGLTYSPDDVVDNKGLLVLRSSNIRNGSLVYEDNVFVNKEVKEDLLTKEDDILICARNGSKSLIGKNALINSKASNLTFGAFMSIYRSKYNKFLFHMFQTELYKKQISVNLGATINQITTKHLNAFIFPIPPKHEQEKIAKILSTWDLAIEKQEQLIEKKKEFKKGLMQRLLSGKVRFKAFNDKWKVVSLGSIFDRITEKNGVGAINVLTISAQNGLVNQEGYFNKSVSSKDLSGYYLLKKGDFAYNKSYSNGYPLGAIKRLNNYEEGVVSPLYICFRAKEKISTCFYEQYFESGFLNKEIFKIAQEGARNHGLLNVSVTEFFKDIKIAQPSLEEQNKIAEVLIDADKEIELLEKELDALKLQKKGLMQRLLTGEVRV